MGTLVGCKFHILDVYIISFLQQKRLDPHFFIQEVNEVDIYKFDPFELPGLSEFQSDQQVWYFFSEPDYRNASSKKPQRARAAGAGYWKSTGHGRHVKDDNCKTIGSKRTLVFYMRERKPGRPSKETKTNWVMHEFYVKDSPCFKKNFVICYIEKQPNKKSSVSTPGDGQPSPSFASDSVSHVVEDAFTEVQSQELPSNPLISDTENQITANTFLEVEADQPLSTHNMGFHSGNHFPESTSLMVEPQAVSPSSLISQLGNHAVKNNIPRVDPQLPSIYGTAFDYRNLVVQKVAPQLVLPSSHDMNFSSRDHVAENIFRRMMKSMPDGSLQHQQMVDHQLPLSQNLVSGTGDHDAKNNCSKVDSSPPAGFGAFDSYNAPNHSPFSALQMPIIPEQGSSSSYSNSFSKDSTAWSSQFDGEHEDVVTSQRDFHDKNPREETGQTLLADIDDETIEKMINELFEDIPLDCENRN